MAFKPFFAFWLISIVMLFNTSYGKDNSPDGPSAFAPDPKYDFGTVFDGTEVVHDYIIKNSGTDTLEIKNINPG